MRIGGEAPGRAHSSGRLIAHVPGRVTATSDRYRQALIRAAKLVVLLSLSVLLLLMMPDARRRPLATRRL